MEHIVLYIGKAGVQNLGKGTGVRFYSFSHTATLFQRTLTLVDITAVGASAGLHGIRKFVFGGQRKSGLSASARLDSFQCTFGSSLNNNFGNKKSHLH